MRRVQQILKELSNGERTNEMRKKGKGLRYLRKELPILTMLKTLSHTMVEKIIKENLQKKWILTRAPTGSAHFLRMSRSVSFTSEP